jgi:hypothetical protein
LQLCCRRGGCGQNCLLAAGPGPVVGLYDDLEFRSHRRLADAPQFDLDTKEREILDRAFVEETECRLVLRAEGSGDSDHLPGTHDLRRFGDFVRENAAAWRAAPSG